MSKNVFILVIIISGLNLNSFCQYQLISSMASSKWTRWSQTTWNLVHVKMVPLHTMLINPKLQQPDEGVYQSSTFPKLLELTLQGNENSNSQSPLKLGHVIDLYSCIPSWAFRLWLHFGEVFVDFFFFLYLVFIRFEEKPSGSLTDIQNE